MEPVTIAALVVVGAAWWKKRHAVQPQDPAGQTEAPKMPKRPDLSGQLKQGACNAEALRDKLGKQIGLPTPPPQWSNMSCDQKLSWLYAVASGAPGFYAIAHAILTSSEYNRMVNSVGDVVTDTVHGVDHAAQQVEHFVKGL